MKPSHTFEYYFDQHLKLTAALREAIGIITKTDWYFCGYSEEKIAAFKELIGDE